MIATLRQTTTRAKVPTLGERLGYSLPASTGLTRAAWVNLNELAPGAFSLVREFIQEGAPSRITNGLCRHTVGKALDIQVLSYNDAVVVGQCSRKFVLEVGALILDMFMLPLQQGNG